MPGSSRFATCCRSEVFTRSSRYDRVADRIYADRAGRQLPYKALRFIPDVQPRGAHLVQDLDRLDLISERYFKDPEQFWRVCDANRALRPDDLLRIGDRLIIPEPLG